VCDVGQQSPAWYKIKVQLRVAASLVHKVIRFTAWESDYKGLRWLQSKWCVLTLWGRRLSLTLMLAMLSGTQSRSWSAIAVTALLIKAQNNQQCANMFGQCWCACVVYMLSHGWRARWCWLRTYNTYYDHSYNLFVGATVPDTRNTQCCALQDAIVVHMLAAQTTIICTIVVPTTTITYPIVVRCTTIMHVCVHIHR